MFNPEIHKVKNIIIECGRALRVAKGLPEELNITILYEEASLALGLPLIPTTTREANHLPAPYEMVGPNGMPIIPRKDCPQCGRKDGLSLKSICPSCTDSEGGKYHTMYSCEEIGPDRKPIGCGFKTEKSEVFMVQRMSELNPNWQSGMKQELGIKTITDTGLK
jgi:hypothetical protein